MSPYIKEYHFHTYYFQNNEQSRVDAQHLYDLVKDLEFTAVPSKFNEAPIGPHPIGSFETWVPQESFAEAYSWFLMNRGGLSILVHPLTKDEVDDHTNRDIWMGPSIPLNVARLEKHLPEVPAQYPELRLGYSKKPWHNVPKPTLAADIVVFAKSSDSDTDNIILIQRKYEPFKGCWALPGGHVNKDEPLEAAARRELEEETGIAMEKLSQFYTFGDPGRDPRGWTVSVGFMGKLDHVPKLEAGDDAELAQWFSIDSLPDLAFDHVNIIKKAQLYKFRRNLISLVQRFCPPT